jgi:hypothetical protein
VLVSGYRFSHRERYVIAQMHGDRCYMCGVPLTLLSMVVDHVIPEKLSDDPVALASARTALGLTPTFEIDSYENWLPACGPCNSVKRANVFEPSLLVQLHLQRTAQKADAARLLDLAGIRDTKIARAVGTLLAAAEGRALDEHHVQALEPLVSGVVAARTPPDRVSPVWVSHGLALLADDGHVRIFRGPYGIGGAPAVAQPHPSFDCPQCGPTAWEGARCIRCGQFSDD